jgi:hypothetical protein
MNKLQILGASIGAGVATLLFTVGAFAQTVTPPVMDSEIQGQVLGVVTGMKDTIFQNIIAVLPVAGIVLVTLMGIGVLFGWFHRIARH